MASTSEIRRRISSVQETQKITHAMYLISSAKMRKARAELDEVRPYFDVLNHEITRVFTVDETVDSRYFTAYGNDSEYGEGTLGCLVITADKGLAGAYNHNVLKEAQRIYEEHPDTEFFVIGRVRPPLVHAEEAAHGRLLPLHRAEPEHLPRAADRPRPARPLRLGRDRPALCHLYRLQGYVRGRAPDALLPLRRQSFSVKSGEEQPEPTFEFVPTMEAVLDKLVRNYISGYIYSALVDSFAASRARAWRQ